MRYVVYRRFKDRALCGDVNIPAKTRCEERNGVIYCNNEALCLTTSENAHTYLALDDDGYGLLRGSLVLFILNKLKNKDNNYQARWDRIWADDLCQKYRREEHPDHWLWSHNFYEASINDLKYIKALIQER